MNRRPEDLDREENVRLSKLRDVDIDLRLHADAS